MQELVSVGPYDAATVMVFEAREKALQHDLFCPTHGELVDPEDYHLLDEDEGEY